MGLIQAVNVFKRVIFKFNTREQLVSASTKLMLQLKFFELSK